MGRSSISVLPVREKKEGWIFGYPKKTGISGKNWLIWLESIARRMKAGVRSAQIVRNCGLTGTMVGNVWE
jgi:hypothetical protein